MSKQTAVEWLIAEIQQLPLEHRLEKQHLYYHALKMEKEQIEEAWKRGNLPTSLGRVLTEKDYYNETYGGDK